MIRVAVIGFGFMGLTHVLHIRKNKKLNLQAIITRNPAQVPDKLRRQTGNFALGDVDAGSILAVPRYASLRECLIDHDLDAVHICTHTDLHYDMAREAMEHGLHVLLEKPMTLRLEEAILLQYVAAQQKVKLMVAHVVRFMPAYKQLKTWIDEQHFGPLSFIALTRFSGLPSWGQWQEKKADFGTSGGALFDLLVHDIDYLQYVLGEPAKIEATCIPGALSMHDYVTARWYYGTVDARVEGGNIFHAQFPFQAGFKARFRDASVVYNSYEDGVIHLAADGELKQVAVADANQGFYNEIDYFATCIEKNNEPLECMPQSSVLTLKLCYDHA